MRISLLVASLWLATSPLKDKVMHNACFAKDLPFTL